MAPFSVMASALAATMLYGTTWAADMSGCGTTHRTGAYNNNGGKGYNVTSGGYNRTYTIYVPSTYDPNTPAGVVISYHGRNGNSDAQYNLTHFYNETWNPHYLSVYPQGLLGSSNESAWEGPAYAVPGVDDLQFTKDLLAHLRATYCIDSTRIYASGKSNGGGFVDTLACSPEGAEFAAFSACSAALYTDNQYNHTNCNASRSPLPFLEFHGSADTTIPYNGGSSSYGGTTPPIPTWLNYWGVRNGCASGAGRNTSEYNGVVQHANYNCSNAINITQGYWIKGMAHSWPSTTSNSDNIEHGDGPTVLDATPLIIQFYNKYTLKSA